MNENDIRDALMIARHLGGCAAEHCRDQHGSYPESVSCSCECHRGQRDRWPDLRQRWSELEAKYLGHMPEGKYQ